MNERRRQLQRISCSSTLSFIEANSKGRDLHAGQKYAFHRFEYAIEIFRSSRRASIGSNRETCCARRTGFCAASREDRSNIVRERASAVSRKSTRTSRVWRLKSVSFRKHRKQRSGPSEKEREAWVKSWRFNRLSFGRPSISAAAVSINAPLIFMADTCRRRDHVYTRSRVVGTMSPVCIARHVLRFAVGIVVQTHSIRCLNNCTINCTDNVYTVSQIL